MKVDRAYLQMIGRDVDTNDEHAIGWMYLVSSITMPSIGIELPLQK